MIIKFNKYKLNETVYSNNYKKSVEQYKLYVEQYEIVNEYILEFLNNFDYDISYDCNVDTYNAKDGYYIDCNIGYKFKEYPKIIIDKDEYDEDIIIVPIGMCLEGDIKLKNDNNDYDFMINYTKYDIQIELCYLASNPKVREFSNVFFSTADKYFIEIKEKPYNRERQRFYKYNLRYDN